jgi:intracellular sulfur oxidation DsrE/DsrF family protein
MQAGLVTAVVAVVLAAPSSVAAQTGEALIKSIGAQSPVPNPTFVADKSAQYKVAWDVTASAATPGARAPGFAQPANFLVNTDVNGVDRKRVHLAIVVHGAATFALMTNAAYKAMYGVDNPNIDLLQALDGAGVQVILCGQAAINRKIARDQLLPFVKVATTAGFALATLHAQGYMTFMP